MKTRSNRTYTLTTSDGSHDACFSRTNHSITIKTKSALSVHDFDIRSADGSIEINTYPYMNMLQEETTCNGVTKYIRVEDNQNPKSDYFTWYNNHRNARQLVVRG
jgi:hypothetical protein